MSDYIYGSSLRAAKSKANYLFEGDFRRRPNQNLSGASRSLARGELLQQAAEQRQSREDVRRREQATLKIQSVWRGHRSRESTSRLMRQQFDSKIGCLDPHDNSCTLNEHDYNLLTRQFIICYHSNQDEARLNSFIGFTLAHKDMVMRLKSRQPDIWLYRFTNLLKMDLNVLRKNSSHLDMKYIMFLENFTRRDEILSSTEASSVWKFLVKHGFYSSMRHLLDTNPKFNSGTYDDNDPLVKTLSELTRRSLDTDITENTYLFFNQFLHGPLSHIIEQYFYPEFLKLKPVGLNPKCILRSFKESKLNTKCIGMSKSIMGSGSDTVDECRTSIWTCYSFVKAIHSCSSELDENDKVDYLCILAILLEPADYITTLSMMQAAASEDVDQVDGKLYDIDTSARLSNFYTDLNSVISKLIRLINDSPHINCLRPLIFDSEIKPKVRKAITQVCNLMLDHETLAIFHCRLLHLVAFNREFLRSLWKNILTTTSTTLFGTSTPIYLQLIQGNNISYESWKSILPQLKLLCSLYKYLLPTLDDEEFYTRNENEVFSAGPTSTKSSSQELMNEDKNYSNSYFMDKELVNLCAILRDLCVGFIEILYQDNRYLPNNRISGRFDNGFSDDRTRLLTFETKTCFKALVRLVCQLHAIDSRKQFCPDGHWICSSLMVPANKAIDFHLVTSQQGRLLTQMTKDDERTNSTPSEIKTVLILQEIPFVISFHDRVQIFHQLLRKEKMIHQSEGYHFGLPGTAIQLQVRRNYIYEDSFEKLSPSNEPNMKLPLKVSLINAVGANEAGIDGGGLSKEFLSELLRAGFDPMRGFFKSTRDQLLYPNPSANVIFSSLPEGFELHYEFLGRILGKAIFEKIMVELPLASFFLAKLLAREHSSDVDLHNLASLDPMLYKNLVYLKNYKGDVADLNLDFTISNNDLDEHEVVELKPNGSKIPVTRENKIEYVHLVADYRLNKQIRIQCAAFKRGLSQLIDLDWLRMFDPRELQILISGTPTDIDTSDWRRNTLYANGYSEKSEAIINFWRVVDNLNENQKRKLLKFATSCSLPPLLGFKDLVPQFTIAPAEETRLPTASTCMNLLKLPNCEDECTMRDKLLYAIESNSGFELS